MLMQLTKLQGDPIGINPETVVKVDGGPGKPPVETATWVSISRGRLSYDLQVRETVEEVIAKVNAATSKGD